MHFSKVKHKKNRPPIEQNGYLYDFIEKYLTVNPLQHIQNKLWKGSHYPYIKNISETNRDYYNYMASL